MLRRINEIAQSGNFISHLSDPGLKDFATISIVYGPNGSGKSSLSNAFLSAKAGTPRVKAIRFLNVSTCSTART
jgi:AAA15 family ATPase/GTPase